VGGLHLDSLPMAMAIGLLVISCGAIVAGWGNLSLARRMRTFQTTRGEVVAREVARMVGADVVEARWGKGGGYRPKVTYAYMVDGVAFSSDQTSHAHHGLRRSIAEQQLAAIPDEVVVHYNPAAPQEAYLQKHGTRLGSALIAGGVLGVMIGLIALLG